MSVALLTFLKKSLKRCGGLETPHAQTQGILGRELSEAALFHGFNKIPLAYAPICKADTRNPGVRFRLAVGR